MCGDVENGGFVRGDQLMVLVGSNLAVFPGSVTDHFATVCFSWDKLALPFLWRLTWGVRAFSPMG